MKFLKKSLLCIAFLIMAGCASKMLPTQYSIDDRQYGGLDINEYTQSELYAISAVHLNVPPETVFAKVSDHRNLRDWVPMIDHLVEVDHSNSLTPGKSNVGTVRVCDFGGDRLVEDIRYWQEGVGYAYSVRDDESVAVTDHLGVMWVESDNKGGSYFVWRQFFNKKPWSVKAQIMPMMMSYVMNNAMESLVEDFGGEVL